MFGKDEVSALVSLNLKLQLARGFAESGICGWMTNGLILQPSAEARDLARQFLRAATSAP